MKQNNPNPPVNPYLKNSIQYGEVKKRFYDSFLDRLDRYAEELESRKSAKLAEEYLAKERERQILVDRTPLSPSKWINTEYFSGSLARDMYPKLKDVFIRVFEGNYHEVVMGGSTRYGKSTLALSCMGYSLYLVSCRAFPQRAFRLMEESPLLFLSLNTTEEKARSAFFNKFSSWVRSTTYFAKEFCCRPNVITQLQFPKHVLMKYSGAKKTAAESEDLLFFVGDEANLYDVIENSKRSNTGEKYDAAETIEAAVNLRMNGTFMLPDGSFPSECKIIWLCKETYPDSFIRRRIKDIRRKGLDCEGQSLIVESTEWGMKPEGTYIGKSFWIKTPTRIESARIIDDEDEAAKYRLKFEKLDNFDKPEDERFQVIEVPMVHRNAAEKKINEFLRDMCGIPTDAIRLFLNDKNLVFLANRDPSKCMPLKTDQRIEPKLCLHPFTGETMNFENGVQFVGKMCHGIKTGNILRGDNGRDDRFREEVVFRPMVNPDVPRYVHIDTGLTGDSAGFCMGHCYGYKKILRLKDIEDSKGNREVKAVEEVVPITWIDVMLEITPPRGGQIPFSGLRGLVYSMQQMGFIIGKVTCDSFQHVAITQPLIEARIEVEIISVDKKTDPYDALLTAYNEERISHYSYPIYEYQITQLERIRVNTKEGKLKEKIDHPPQGKKDVSDAVASVVFQVEKNSTQKVYIPAEVLKDEVNVSIDKVKRGITVNDAFERGDFEKMMEIMGGRKF